MDDVPVPQHLVIIPDGNRRWAKERGLSVEEGYKKAKDNALKVHKEEQTSGLIKAIRESGIKYATIWGFSTDNWKRDTEEVNWLMDIFYQNLLDIKKEVLKHNIRFHHFGRKDRLPEKLVQEINDIEEKTKGFDEYHLGVALDYGGRDELLRAFTTLKETNAEITEESISQALDTKDFPDADFIIRTSGEQRTSGMMPWQSVYAEYYFTEKKFPDFTVDDLKEAIAEFGRRKRRFGGT